MTNFKTKIAILVISFVSFLGVQSASAQVEGFFEDYSFEDYIIFMYDFVLAELKAATKELRDWELKDHPQYRGNKR